MTRILQVGDVHLGILAHGRPDPRTGVNSRILDIGRCWRRACQIATDRAVDLMVVTGDVFDRRNPDALALNLFEDGLRKLKEAGIPVLAIPGNHDGALRPGQRSILEVFHDPPLVHVQAEAGVVEIEGIRVACLPWVSPQALMTKLDGAGPAQVGEALVEALRRVLGWLRTEKADVLALHWSVEGAVYSNERDVTIGGEPVIPVPDLDGPWRWVAAGHIHKEQGIRAPATASVEANLIGAYSGSVDRVSFGEEAERKVALEIDLEPEFCIPDAHELPARPFVTFDILEGALVLDRSVEEAVVRVRGCPPGDAARTQRDLYAAGAHMVEIQPVRPERDRPARAADLVEGMGPLEGLEEWFGVRGIPEDDRPPLRERAKGLLEEAGP